MRNSTFNTFSELNSDTHPVNTKNSLMSDAINVALTTKGHNQLILQNMQGTDLFSMLKPGYTPLGVNVYNNIAYILSGLFNTDGTFVTGEIGTFPSPDWAGLIAQSPQDPNYFLPLLQAYSPLYNFSNSNIDSVLNNDINYYEEFNTSKFNFLPGRLIELELQPSYDDSVNAIFTDDYNPIRLINSRFRVSPDGKSAALADRRQSKDTNTYSNKRFGATRLIKRSDLIPDLQYLGVFPGGHHPGGGYRFYFKYSDSDGALTDVIEESRSVIMAYDNHGATETEDTGKLVKFRISNIDRKFSGIKIYYSYASGGTDTTTSIYEIVNFYDITSNTMDITIYGNEPKSLKSADFLNIDYSNISTAKSITQSDDRLVIANITNSVDTYDTLRVIAQQLQIKQSSRDMVIKGLGNGYANPDNVYNFLGYWAGETVELGIVFVLPDGKGNTPVFPIRGGDNYENNFTYSGTSEITNASGFKINSNTVPGTENRLGVFRTWKSREMLKGNNVDSTGVIYFSVDITALKSDPYILDNTIGFFFVRKERKRDCITQGYLTNVTKVPLSKHMIDTGYYTNQTLPTEWDNESLTHLQDIFSPIGKYTGSDKFLPAPGRLWETTVDMGVGGNKDGGPVTLQGRVIPDQNTNEEMHYAFYSGDQLADPQLTAATFNGGTKGLMVNSDGATNASSDLGSNSIFYGIVLTDTDHLPLTTVGESDTLLSPRGYTVESISNVRQRVSINLVNVHSKLTSLYTSIKTTDAIIFEVDNNNNIITGSMSTTNSATTDNIVDGGVVTGTWDFLDFTTTAGATTYNYNISISNFKIKEFSTGTIYTMSGHMESGTFNVTSVQLNFTTAPVKELELGVHNFKPTVLIPDSNRQTYFQYVGEGQEAYSGNQFSATENRNYYLVASNNHYTTWNYVVTGTPDADYFFSNNVQFSEYVGVRMTKGESQIINALKNDATTVVGMSGLVLHPSGYSAVPATVSWFNDSLKDYNYAIRDRGIRLAMLTNVYDSNTGALTLANWKGKYTNTALTDTYSAISKRYTWATSPNIMELFDGDCFIAHVYKRISRGLGIPGVPTATDPSVYRDGNQSTGLRAKGFVIPIVTENNYNVALRSFQQYSETEKALYGKSRTFYPIDNIDALRSSRQPESTGYNHGYDFTYSDKNYVSLNDRSPSLDINYGNRILVSERSAAGDFKNGYLDFSGLNFKDYNKQLGEITKVIAHNNFAYCIFEQGVGVIPLTQRTMMSEAQGGIFIDNAQVLANKMEIVSTEYGSDQQFSIIKTDLSVYGCDLNKNKIWRITSAQGGHNLELISDFAVQSIISQFKDRITKNSYARFIKANYDRERNHVIFSYMNEDSGHFYTDNFDDAVSTNVTPSVPVNPNPTTPGGTTVDDEIIYPKSATLVSKSAYISPRPSVVNSIGSLYWNETINKWVSRLSWTPLWMYNIENNLYSFNAIKDTHIIWKHFSETVPYSFIYGEQHKFIFEFVVVDKSTMQKIITNLMLVSNRVFPGRISYTLLENDVDYDSFASTNSSYVDLLRQRHEIEPSVGWNITTIQITTGGVNYINFNLLISEHEAERLVGSYFTNLVDGNIYIVGPVLLQNGVYYNQLLDVNGAPIVGPNPSNFVALDRIEFGIIKQNMEYIEDHLYIETGKEQEGSTIRDKAVKIKVEYEGYDYVTVQTAITSFIYSFN